LHNCHDTFGKLPTTLGVFPVVVPGGPNNVNWGANPVPSKFGSQQYFLLPFIEQDNAYKDPILGFSTTVVGTNTVTTNTPHQSNSWWSNQVVKTFQAPGDPSLTADGRGWATGGYNQGRGLTSYASNWHAFGGGWGEDWQSGGKARIPQSFPDGTSSTIAYFERYAKCGDPAMSDQNSGTWSQTSCGIPVSRANVWNEDGQNSGPVAQNYAAGNGTYVWEVAAWWASYHSACTGGPQFTDPNSPPQRPGLPYPLYYPFSFITLPQVGPTWKTGASTPNGCDPTRLQAFNAGGINVLFMDGSAKTVSSGVSQLTWSQLIVPDDGQVVGSNY
jgi:prepilin-type processing-associated H-X9-DG protein